MFGVAWLLAALPIFAVGMAFELSLALAVTGIFFWFAMAYCNDMGASMLMIYWRGSLVSM